MLVNLDMAPNEMIRVPTDIWTKGFKLSVFQYRLPLWARAEWREASTKLTSQIMSEALDFTEI